MRFPYIARKKKRKDQFVGVSSQVARSATTREENCQLTPTTHIAQQQLNWQPTATFLWWRARWTSRAAAPWAARWWRRSGPAACSWTSGAARTSTSPSSSLRWPMAASAAPGWTCSKMSRTCPRRWHGSPNRWEPVRFDQLPVKPVWPGSGLDRYQTGPNSKFKFELKKLSSTGSYRYTGRFDRFTGRFDW